VAPPGPFKVKVDAETEDAFITMSKDAVTFTLIGTFTAALAGNTTTTAGVAPELLPEDPQLTMKVARSIIVKMPANNFFTLVLSL